MIIYTQFFPPFHSFKIFCIYFYINFLYLHFLLIGRNNNLENI